VFLLAVLVLALAAVNTGNNALVALLGFALASFAVSGAWSRQMLAACRVEARSPLYAFAGQSVIVETTITNESRVFPAFGLVVRDATGTCLLTEPVLGRSEQRHHSVELTFPDRGWHPLGPWRVEVLLPLGLFLKSKRVVASQQVLVYPHLLADAAEPEPHLGNHTMTELLTGRGIEGEAIQLRQFRDGDERRQVHWKQTARQAKLIVIDRQRRARRSAMLRLDTHVRDPLDPQTRQQFELLVSRAATAVVQRLRNHEPVGLVLGARTLAPVASLTHARQLLEPLATVSLQPLESA